MPVGAGVANESPREEISKPGPCQAAMTHRVGNSAALERDRNPMPWILCRGQ